MAAINSSELKASIMKLSMCLRLRYLTSIFIQVLDLLIYIVILFLPHALHQNPENEFCLLFLGNLYWLKENPQKLSSKTHESIGNIKIFI